MRWIAQDPTTGSTYTFPLNPKKMTTPLPTTATQENPAPTSWGFNEQSPMGPFTRVLNSDPVSWTFSGFIHDAALLACLQSLYVLKHRFYLTDHLNRSFIARVMQVDVTEHQPSHTKPIRYEYTATVMSYGPTNPPAFQPPTI